MSSNIVRLPLDEHGCGSGFINLIRKENRTWWGTRKWWVQAILWLFVSNAVLAFIMWVIPLIDPTSQTATGGSAVYELMRVFLQMESYFVPFGVMILAMGLIVNEKKLGTAAWLLSNPVSRSSFVYSKLLGHGWAIFIIVVTIPSLAAFLQVALKAGRFFDPLPFIYASGALCLLFLFYFTMVLMFGTLFSSTGPVIGIPIAILVAMSLLPQILGQYLPWLIMSLPSRLTELAMTIVMGQSLPLDWRYPVIISSVLVVVFIAVAILRSAREEF